MAGPAPSPGTPRPPVTITPTRCLPVRTSSCDSTWTSKRCVWPGANPSRQGRAGGAPAVACSVDAVNGCRGIPGARISTSSPASTATVGCRSREDASAAALRCPDPLPPVRWPTGTSSERSPAPHLPRIRRADPPLPAEPRRVTSRPRPAAPPGRQAAACPRRRLGVPPPLTSTQPWTAPSQVHQPCGCRRQRRLRRPGRPRRPPGTHRATPGGQRLSSPYLPRRPARSPRPAGARRAERAGATARVRAAGWLIERRGVGPAHVTCGCGRQHLDDHATSRGNGQRHGDPFRRGPAWILTDPGRCWYGSLLRAGHLRRRRLDVHGRAGSGSREAGRGVTARPVLPWTGTLSERSA